MDFDKESFSKILVKIKNSYGSINKMAEKTDVTAAYISKLIRLMYRKAPSPEILKKIGDNSNGVTTYNELMNICGYTDANLDVAINKMLRDEIQKQYIEEAINIKLTPEEDKIYQSIISKFPIKEINDDDTEEIILKKISSYIKNPESINNQSKEKILKKASLFIEYANHMAEMENMISEAKTKAFNARYGNLPFEFLKLGADLNFDIDFKELENQINILSKTDNPSEYNITLDSYVKTLPKKYQSKMIDYINMLVDYTTSFFVEPKKEEHEFRYAYHKETEGMTDEEIKDALRFYKEMKKKVQGKNNGTK